MRILARDLAGLGRQRFDIVVIGGGIFGACVAWDASLRGLSVALLEQGDFSHATSANHFKMVHGGIRYLQHGDVSRIRESSRERSALLRIAPHLVAPLPILIPTYGHGIKGKELLAMGMAAYDLLTWDRNRGLQPARRIPGGQLLSRQEVLKHFPDLPTRGLTGGALFRDGQMYNSPRMALSFLRAAVAKGAMVANYARVNAFLRKDDRILGITGQDVLTGEKLEVHGKLVVNTAGPWAHRLLANDAGLCLRPPPVFSRDLALVTSRPWPAPYGLACPIRSQDADSVLDRGGRHLFVVPWRGHSLVGVWHKVFPKTPEQITVSEEDLSGFIGEANQAYPGLGINREDISMINMGLTLFGDESRQAEGKISFGKRSRLVDHVREDGVEGLITLIGVRATTARGMAEKVIDLFFAKNGWRKIRSKTAEVPIYGGDIEWSASNIARIIEHRPAGVTAEEMQDLLRNHGSCYQRVLGFMHGNGNGGGALLAAEVRHAVHEEMAQKLGDVVFRRTSLGAGGHPGVGRLETCAKVMAAELEWCREKELRELEEVANVFSPTS